MIVSFGLQTTTTRFRTAIGCFDKGVGTHPEGHVESHKNIKTRVATEEETRSQLGGNHGPVPTSQHC